ncbi:GNAT family N-acetyltransferase [Chitinophagaceae bacterium LWZ2-11]
MSDVQLRLNDRKRGAFYITENNEQLAEMVIGINGSDLTVYHTEVSEKAEGKGFAKKLLETMVAYARANQLKVIALCPFVHAQFKRHPELYEDIWKHTESN